MTATGRPAPLLLGAAVVALSLWSLSAATDSSRDEVPGAKPGELAGGWAERRQPLAQRPAFVPAGPGHREDLPEEPPFRGKRTLPDGTTIGSVGPIVEARAGVLSPDALFERDRPAMTAIQAGLGGEVVGAQMDRCILDLYARTGGPPEVDVRWSHELRIESRGGVGRVIAVHVEPDRWPPLFDEPAKHCFTAIFTGRQFATKHDFAFTTAYPLCFGKRTPQ